MSRVNSLEGWLYEKRTMLKLLLDLGAWSSLTFVSFLIRFDGEIAGWWPIIGVLTLTMLGVKALAMIMSGNYLRSWSRVSYIDLFMIAVMVIGVTSVYIAGVLFVRDLYRIPLSIPVLEALLAIPVLAATRMATRYAVVYKGWTQSLRKQRGAGSKSGNQASKRVVIAGAGESGTMAAREMLRNPQVGLIPVGFVDDDSTKIGQKMMGIPVLDKVAGLVAACRDVQADEVLIAMPSENGKVIRHVVENAQKTGLPYRTLPGMYDVISGNVGIDQIRKVNVEDLLRRKPVRLEMQSIGSYLKDRCVLVTGAGGSIGSELARQLLNHGPRSIVLLGRGENSVHEVNRELTELSSTGIQLKSVICDVRDRISLERVFDAVRPDVVFHAAAHKHVYLMEGNPDQAVFNNVFGTHNVVQLCFEYGIRRLVNISTDKAVNPTSVMGASKRIAEQVVVRGSMRAKQDQVFTSVRFGNVLGSRGSVIPIFNEQIRKGGPVTVTHPEMVRYFMTIPEAAQLVIQAGALAVNGQIYVLDMGEPVRIVDMARDLIRLSGLEPDLDVKIKYTGVKPGEKLYEELLTSEEGTTMSQHESIYIAKSRALAGLHEDEFDRALNDLLDIVTHRENGGLGVQQEMQSDIRLAIKRLVPSYSMGRDQGERMNQQAEA